MYDVYKVRNYYVKQINQFIIGHNLIERTEGMGI